MCIEKVHVVLLILSRYVVYMAIKYTIDTQHLQQDHRQTYNVGRKMENITSYLVPEIKTSISHTLKSWEEAKLSWCNNQTRFKMEKPCK